MKRQKHKRRYALAVLLFAVSLLAIAPTFTLAVQQSGAITINATGQAIPIDKKGTGGPATLSLTGNVHTEGSDPLKLTGLTGNLQVGGTTYPISDGQGEANKKGTIEINAKSNGNGNHKYELILHGNMQENNVNFDAKQSKLSSQFFLSLSGQVNISTSTFSSSSSSTSSSSTSSQAANTVTQTVTVTETTSLTSLQNNTVTQNVTQTLNSNVTTTVFGNVTVTETVNNGTTTTVSNNQTVTETVTQPLNQTITFTVTNTVGNSTITQTVTTTVANQTITETATTTVANTTITVTNTTATGP